MPAIMVLRRSDMRNMRARACVFPRQPLPMARRKSAPGRGEQKRRYVMMRNKLLLGTTALLLSIGVATAPSTREGAGGAAGGSATSGAAGSRSSGSHASPGGSGAERGGQGAGEHGRAESGRGHS